MKIKAIKEKLGKIADEYALRQECIDLYENGIPKGISTGWPFFDEKLTLLKGQLNILTGYPGSGKSAWLENLACNMAKNENWNILIMSPEAYPISGHVNKLVEKLSGKITGTNYNAEKLTPKEFSEWMDFVFAHFVFLDASTEEINLDEILTTIRFCRQMYGKKLDMAIIDPWNELENHRPKDITETDYIGQSLKLIRKLSRNLEINFWIVAHPAKPQGPKEQQRGLSLYDISGSSHWANKSDNGLIVTRQYEAGLENKVKIEIKKVKNRHYGKTGEHIFDYYMPTETYHDFQQGG